MHVNAFKMPLHGDWQEYQCKPYLHGDKWNHHVNRKVGMQFGGRVHVDTLNYEKPQCFQAFSLYGPLPGPFWTPWGSHGSPWAPLGSLGGLFGVSWAPFGAHLGHFGVPLVPIGAPRGTLGRHGPHLGSLCATLGPF